MIKTAIIPIAGLGTRLLPASKSIPKEMITIVDRPIIEYIVQEAVHSGIEQIVFVTSATKTSVENYFDQNLELEKTLQEKNKLDLLREITNIIPSHISIVSVRQSAPLGLGHAILCAKDIIGDRDFAVLLPDVIVESNNGKYDLQSMINEYKTSKAAQIMVESVPVDIVDQYGIVDIEKNIEQGESVPLKDIVEKPSINDAPSNLSVIGRYVLPASTMKYLEKTSFGKGNEIQLTDALASMLKDSVDINAYRMKGRTFDCGNKIGYFQAVLHFGANHPDLGDKFKQHIRDLKV